MLLIQADKALLSGYAFADVIILTNIFADDEKSSFFLSFLVCIGKTIAGHD